MRNPIAEYQSDPVDLAGRLSNPPEAVETLADKGLQASPKSRQALGAKPERASEHSSDTVPEEEGRLSNPVQGRLSDAAVDELVRDYLAGSSIDSLATQFGVHRTTIIHHLDHRHIERRRR